MLKSLRKFLIYFLLGAIVIIFIAFVYIQFSSWFRIKYKVDEPITMIGLAEICLHYRDKTPGWHTASCHRGILGLDGRRYGMDRESLPPHCRITSSRGIFIFKGVLHPLPLAETGYDAVGTIEINKIKRLTGERFSDEPRGYCPAGDVISAEEKI
jgi:hypothetical protein